MVSPGLQIEFLQDNKESAEKMHASPRDTVQLYAPLYLATSYPDIISQLEVIEDTQGQSLDKWIAIVPHLLIEDNVIVQEANGYYKFQTEIKVMDILYSVSEQMVHITTTYLPLIVLLTAPFIALSLYIIQRKKKFARMSHFIFALHYTAFLELLITFIYVLFLAASPSIDFLQWILIIGSCSYLAVAFRRVYENGSWFGAITKSILTCLIYLMICLMICLVIFFIACFIVAKTV